MTEHPYPVAAEKQRIAVVGSGIAGLTAAHLLSRKYAVTIFEREHTIGMDAFSTDHAGARMDIPLRVFSEAYYPSLCKLYRMLGVRYHAADYSFCLLRPDAPAYFRYINILRAGKAIPVPCLWHLGSLAKCARLLLNWLHFLRHSPRLLELPESAGLSLASFLKLHGYPKEFATDLLLPMLSVVCTCSFAAVEEYPAAFVVDYFADKYGLSGAQCRAIDGTKAVAERLSAGAERVEVGAAVAAVTPEAGGGVTVRWRRRGGGEVREKFAQVVLATQANASQELLSGAKSAGAAALAGALRAVRYERHRVVLHEDASLMPPSRADWSPLNIEVAADAGAASCTVWMNRIDAALASSLQRNVFQTWNPTAEPAADLVVVDLPFDRPVMNAKTVEALAEVRDRQGEGGVWIVGAYSRLSMPLLENGVQSAIDVATALGVDCSDIAFVPPKADGGSALPTLFLLLAAGLGCVCVVLGFPARLY